MTNTIPDSVRCLIREIKRHANAGPSEAARHGPILSSANADMFACARLPGYRVRAITENKASRRRGGITYKHAAVLGGGSLPADSITTLLCLASVGTATNSFRRYRNGCSAGPGPIVRRVRRPREIRHRVPNRPPRNRRLVDS